MLQLLERMRKPNKLIIQGRPLPLIAYSTSELVLDHVGISRHDCPTYGTPTGDVLYTCTVS